MTEYRTKTGKVLTDADIEALADEAERGYDVSHLIGKPSRRSTMPDKLDPPDPPEVVLTCSQCDWTYSSDGSVPDDVLEEIDREHHATHQ